RHTVHYPFTIPLPYAVFYYLLPGFQGFRNAARWEMLFILAMAIAISWVLHTLLKEYSAQWRVVWYVILIFGCIVEFNAPMQFIQVPQRKDFPPVSSWLTTTSQNTAIIELPIYNWYMSPYTQNELFREYYSIVNFRKMVNGYSGFSPPPWQDLIVTLLKDFPSKETVTKLKAMKVTYIIIHKKEYDLLWKNNFTISNTRVVNGEVILKKALENNQMRLIKKINDDYIFQIL